VACRGNFLGRAANSVLPFYRGSAAGKYGNNVTDISTYRGEGKVEGGEGEPEDGTKQGGKLQRVRECERERETRNAILIGEEKHAAIINTSVFGASAMEGAVEIECGKGMSCL